MFVDFDKVFQEIDWSKVKLMELCPCRKCQDLKEFRELYPMDNSYLPEKCNHCLDYAKWLLKVVQKLSWVEEQEKE